MLGSPSWPGQLFFRKTLWLAQSGQFAEGESITACASALGSGKRVNFLHGMTLSAKVINRSISFVGVTNCLVFLTFPYPAPVPKNCAIFIGCNYESRASHTEDPSTRKIIEGGTTFNWVDMHTLRNFGPCGYPVKGELKMVGDCNKNVIWTLLLSLLASVATFQQKYHNYQLVVTPNEMVGLHYRYTHWTNCRHLCLVCLWY